MGIVFSYFKKKEEEKEEGEEEENVFVIEVKETIDENGNVEQQICI
jgi:hypothetical protein